MESKKYVWMIHELCGRNEDSLRESFCNKAYRFPVQVRKFAKQHGFSIFDEISSEDNLIIFSKEDNWGNWNGIYANKVEIV